MPLAIPPELKKISPFVRRAEELDRDKTSPESRLVAYYCRQYAVHTGIPLASSSPAAKKCLGHLLGALEAEKPAMDNFTRDEAAFLCRKFATTVFEKADNEDRHGAASKTTARAFYAAASFLQILEQFEPEGSEANEEDRKRILYAKWKATDILKALKEGRTPTPGGYGETEIGDDEEEEEHKKEEKMDSPHVETVTEDSDDGGKEEKADDFDLPPPPSTTVLPPPPVIPPPAEDEPEEESDSQGQEVELNPPPPAYPGESSSSAIDRPKLSFSLPPPVEPAPVKKPSGGGGIFGFGKKKKESVSKAQFADATELTRFALAALDDKNADLAAERLKQALEALGR